MPQNPPRDRTGAKQSIPGAPATHRTIRSYQALINGLRWANTPLGRILVTSPAPPERTGIIDAASLIRRAAATSAEDTDGVGRRRGYPARPGREANSELPAKVSLWVINRADECVAHGGSVGARFKRGCPVLKEPVFENNDLAWVQLMPEDRLCRRLVFA